MTNLLITSRDASEYERLIRQSKISSLNIQIYPNNSIANFDGEHIDIILGDPVRCVEALVYCPNIKWVQSTWAGIKPFFDSARQDFKLTGIKDVFGPQMREYVFAYLLYFSRQIETFNEFQSNQNWSQPLCSALFGKTIGILGMGSIGKEVAKTAKHFGMKVIGIAQTTQELDYVDQFYQLNQFETFANNLDFLVVLLPHTEQTEKLIDKQFLSLLKQQCVLINAGRGQVIDDNALLDALNNQRLKAAVLDVFSQEPLPVSHPFWNTNNLFITQHTAAISKPSDISQIFLDNLDLFRINGNLNNLVDWTKGY